MRILSFFVVGAAVAVAEDNVLDDIIRNLNANSTNSSAASAATSAPSANATSPMAGNATSAPETSAPATSGPNDANATSAPATSAPGTSAPSSASGSASAPASTNAPTVGSGSASAPAATSEPTQGAATSGPAEATSGPASNSTPGNGTTAAPGTDSVELMMKVQATVTPENALLIADEMSKTAGKSVIEAALGGGKTIGAMVAKTPCGTDCKCSKTAAAESTKAECDVCFANARRRRTSEVRELEAVAKEFTVKVTIMDLSSTAADSMKTKLEAAATGTGVLSKDSVKALAATAATTAGVNTTFTVTMEAAATKKTGTTTTTSNAFAMVSAGFGVLIAALLF